MLINFRNLKNGSGLKKTFLNLLNIFGLALGLAVFLFIFQYVEYERSYDQFHEDADDIYRVTYARERPGQTPYVSAASFPALAPTLEQEFDEISSSCRVVPVWGLKGLIVWEEKSLESKFINYADDSFFEFFSFELLAGNPKTALANKHTAVIAKSKADVLFGGESPLGERIEMQTSDGRYFFEITGIFDDSKPTHMTTDVLLSWTSLYEIPGVDRARIENNWQWTQYPAYVKLNPNIRPDQVIAKFPNVIDKYLPDNPEKDLVSFDLQALTSIHLNSHLYREIDENGDAQIVSTLFIIGFMVLIIAWINYVNLYTARATDQLKAVGMRKILGASRTGLFLRFIYESMIFSLVAVLIALAILYLFKPVVIQITGLDISQTFLLTPELIVTVIMLWLLSGLLCGIYPALVLSKLAPLKALNKQTNHAASGRLRSSLVIFQFMASAVLVGGTIVIQQQLKYMSEVDLGVNKENVLAIDAFLYDQGEREHQRKVKLFKNVLSSFPGVQRAAYTSSVIGEKAVFSSSSDVLGRSSANGTNIVGQIIVGPDYLGLIQTELLAGRHFEYESDSMNLIINRKAAALYGFESPELALNEQIVIGGNRDTLKVIGVIEDFIQQSAKNGTRPTVFRNNHWELSKVVVQLDDSYLTSFISFAQKEHAKLFPKSPFTFDLIDEILTRNANSEDNFGKLMNLFSLLTIFIALLGILALSYFMADKRKKEVCVRKVLGSSRESIIALVFKDFAKLVLIGNIVAFPLIYFFANEWLNQFAHRISFSWYIPFATLGLSMLLAFVFSYFNLVGLARINPAVILKNE